MPVALCLALLAAAPPDDGVDWAEATPQEWAVRLTVAAGFGEDDRLKEAVEQIGRLGPRARAAAPALLETLAHLNRNRADGERGPFLLDDSAFSEMGADAIPAVVAAVMSDDRELRRIGWKALCWAANARSWKPPGAVDAAEMRAVLAVAEPGFVEADRALDFLSAFETTFFELIARDEVFETVIRLMDHDESSVRLAAVKAAGTFRERFSQADAASFAAAVAALRRVAAGDSDPAVRDAAIVALANVGAADDLVVPALIEQIRTNNPPDSEEKLNAIYDAVTGLGRYPDRAAEVRAAFQPRPSSWVLPRPGVLFEGTSSMEWGPDAFGFAEIYGSLLDDEEVRVDAVEALGAMGGAAASQLPRLVPLLGEAGKRFEASSARWDDDEFRLKVAEAVAKIAPDHPSLPGFVFPHIPDPPAPSPPDVAATDSIGRRLAEAERAWAVWRILKAMGPHAAPAVPKIKSFLRRGLSSLAVYGAFAAVAAVGPLPDDLLPAFADDAGLMHHNDTHDPLLAAGPRSLPHVAEALKSVPPRPIAEEFKRELAKKVSGSRWTWGPDDFDQAFEDAVTDREYELHGRLWLVLKFPPEALAEHRAALLDAVEPLTEDSSRTVRRWAIATLAAVRPDGPAAFLAAAEDADPRVRAEAVRALAAYGEEAGAQVALADALKDDYATVRLPAVRAWRAAGFDESALTPLRDDPNPAVRLAAGEAAAPGA